VEHYGVAQGNVSRTATGRYQVSIEGIDSQTDGMLFAIGGENNDYNFVTTGALADGSGWEVDLRDVTVSSWSTREDGRWSFVYVDYDAPGLVGGRIAANGDVIAQAGSFTATYVGTGSYRITVPGYTPDDGALVLTVAHMETISSVTSPGDNIITYEATAARSSSISATAPARIRILRIPSLFSRSCL